MRHHEQARMGGSAEDALRVVESESPSSALREIGLTRFLQPMMLVSHPGRLN